MRSHFFAIQGVANIDDIYSNDGKFMMK
jgi:hypothetical protein